MLVGKNTSFSLYWKLKSFFKGKTKGLLFCQPTWKTCHMVANQEYNDLFPFMPGPLEHVWKWQATNAIRAGGVLTQTFCWRPTPMGGASGILACEQGLLFGQAKRLHRSLARSREPRFTRPNIPPKLSLLLSKISQKNWGRGAGKIWHS